MKTKAVPDDYKTVEDEYKVDIEELRDVFGRAGNVSEGESVVEESDFEDEKSSVAFEPVLLNVKRQFNNKGELLSPEESSEIIAVQGFSTAPANPSLSVKHTLNIGKYRSVTIQVGLSVPCYREEYEAAFEFLSETVSKRLVVEIEKALEKAKELVNIDVTRSETTPEKHPF